MTPAAVRHSNRVEHFLKIKWYLNTFLGLPDLDENNDFAILAEIIAALPKRRLDWNVDYRLPKVGRPCGSHPVAVEM